MDPDRQRLAPTNAWAKLLAADTQQSSTPTQFFPLTLNASTVARHGPDVQSSLGTAPADCRFEYVASEKLPFHDAEAQAVSNSGTRQRARAEDRQSRDLLMPMTPMDRIKRQVERSGCDEEGLVFTDGTELGAAAEWGEGKPDAICCVPAYGCGRTALISILRFGDMGRNDADCISSTPVIDVEQKLPGDQTSCVDFRNALIRQRAAITRSRRCRD